MVIQKRGQRIETAGGIVCHGPAVRENTNGDDDDVVKSFLA